MKRYRLKESFLLQSAGKLLLQGTFYATEVEAEITELDKFVTAGSCVEEVSKPVGKAAKAKDATETAPEDDISTVGGLGKAAVEKLAEKGITTKSALGAALTSREEEMKEVLGAKFEKVKLQFVSA